MRLIYSLEDDLDIAKIISVSLTKANYEVKSFSTAKEFLTEFAQKKPDMCLLDLMLPDASGMDILKKIRSDQDNDSMPIIIISAKRMTLDKVEGLDNGADDYIEKPFDILELISRINARFRKDKSNIIHGPFDMDLNKHALTYKGENISLTNTEFEILHLLIANAGNVTTREKIYEKVYKANSEVESRSIDMHVASLRRKIKDKEGKIIRTVYGIGYLMD